MNASKTKLLIEHHETMIKDLTEARVNGALTAKQDAWHERKINNHAAKLKSLKA